MIKVQGVTKKFNDGTIALSDVSFEISSGEFVFLIGPSGAGKTTLFRLLIRDLLPDSGSIILDEQEVSGLRGGKLVEFRRNIGVVFQDLKLLANRSVEENVSLPLEVCGLKSEEIAEKVRKALKVVGLEGSEKMFPSQMSGGELQRVAIARSIVSSPKYLFADEPTGNVDPANSWTIMKILSKINSSGTTVVVATHNSEPVDLMGKRVIKLEAGRIVRDKKGKYKD